MYITETLSRRIYWQTQTANSKSVILDLHELHSMIPQQQLFGWIMLLQDEVLTGKPLFPGKSIVHQLDLITNLLGTPPSEIIARVRNEKARKYLMDAMLMVQESKIIKKNLVVITSNRTKGDELVIIHLGDGLWKEK